MLRPRIDAKVVRQRIGAYADKTSMEQRNAIYRELFGFVPARVEARFSVTGALDPDILDLQEKIREHAMYPKCFDVKTASLMLASFGKFKTAPPRAMKLVEPEPALATVVRLSRYRCEAAPSTLKLSQS